MSDIAYCPYVNQVVLMMIARIQSKKWAFSLRERKKNMFNMTNCIQSFFDKYTHNRERNSFVICCNFSRSLTIYCGGDGHTGTWHIHTHVGILNGCRLLRSQNQANLNKTQSFIIDVHAHATWIHKHSKPRKKTI